MPKTPDSRMWNSGWVSAAEGNRKQAWVQKHLSFHPGPQVQTLAVRDKLPAALALLDERAIQLRSGTSASA